MELLSAVGRLPVGEALAAYGAAVEPRHGGPSTPTAMAEWADYHPALARRLLEAIAEAQCPTTRESLFLRVLAFHRPGDGVWELEAEADAPAPEAAAIGLDWRKPMAKAYATRWDVHGPAGEAWADAFVEHAPGRGIGAKVHPRLFTLVAPRLAPIVSYHALARPGLAITREEWLSFTAFEIFCHRLVRDASARRGDAQ